MASLVVDASVALAWCFGDEATPWTKALLERAQRGDQVVVPAHWSLEISNSLLFAVRRKRIPPERPALFLKDLTLMRIAPEPALNSVQCGNVLDLSAKHGLTVYDGAYLELVRRRRLPLATLDIDLRKASISEGVTLL